MKNSSPSIDVLGVRINVTNMQDAVATIEPWIANGRRKYVCVTGVHGVMECQ